ncbi:hypothetical protein J8M99_26105 (plasmid) [Serratia fonticola]|nr:hypothetical protein [Serratia fonticola]QXN65322.1 hypothetical protein J8M99_26105 [Serratia fonticola]
MRFDNTGTGINTVEVNGEVKHIRELDGLTLEMEWTKLKNEINSLYAKNAHANAGLRGLALRLVGISLPNNKTEAFAMAKVK